MNQDVGEETGGDMLEAARRTKLKRLVELGVDPWGGRFDDSLPIGHIRDMQSQIETQKQDADSDRPPRESGPKVRAAGRIVLQRKKGKLIFADIRDSTGQIQLFIGRKQVGDDDWNVAECFDLGDIIGVDGELKHTRTGELTIFAERLHFLCKSLETPPEKHKGLTDPELRQRMRYLDLIYTEGAVDRFLKRSTIVHSIRNTLTSQRYVEIEGPTLHSVAGGAAARPFHTHHNALDMPLYLRIALELHLKRVLVGGVERVFELGRVYRNEGISPRHNPEFTMLEAYQAYGDYRTMMDLTEQIIGDALTAIGHQGPLTWGDQQIDFSAPFARATYDALFAKYTDVDPGDEQAVARFAKTLDIETADRHADVIKNEVFEACVEDKLKGPIFVIDYPASICPLTKRNRENPNIAERFELFVEGMEIANAYTELNDPDLQEELFKTQLAGQKAEDSMATMDHDFIRALRNGMPPAGGLGIGIDRLTMLLTNSQTIRDVILFPLLRLEAR